MMRLPKFKYFAPREVKDAVTMMADFGPDAMFVAGGTDLYPNMKRRQQTPKTVISIARLRELRQVRGDRENGMVIGSSVSLTDLCNHPAINRDYAFVADAARLYSDTQKHGHDRRKPAARHAVQLLRSELRVAQRHQLLPEERRRYLLGCAFESEVLGSPVIRSCAVDGSDRSKAQTRFSKRRAFGGRGGFIQQRWHPIFE